MNTYKNLAFRGDSATALPISDDEYRAETKRLEAMLRIYQRETNRLLGRHVSPQEGVLRARFLPQARSQAVIRVCD
jgi:hypothetical protein